MNKTPKVFRGDSDTYRRAADVLNDLCASTLAEVFDFVVSRGGRGFICAGAVRDCIHGVLTDDWVQPRDFDIGVQGLSQSDFRLLGRTLKAARNRYGGLSAHLKTNQKIDIWRLEDTVGVRRHSCDPTITNVLRSFVLDVNAVAFEPRADQFFDLGALTALRSNAIGLVPSALLHSNSNFAARAVILALRFSLRMSDELASFVTDNFEAAEVRRQLRKMEPMTFSNLSNAMLVHTQAETVIAY